MSIVFGLKQPTVTEFPMNRIIKSKDAPNNGQSIEALEYASLQNGLSLSAALKTIEEMQVWRL